nr:MAG TPA: restriction alleviation protein [Caudoviricetes sp.]
MPRPERYPDSQVKITAPFFVLNCSCGFRTWSLLGEITPCPYCGRIMAREGGQDVGKQIHI